MIRSAALVAVFFAAAPFTAAQPGDPPSMEPLVRFLLPYIDHAVVQEQLALTPEQTKTLLAHRQKQWDEVYALSPSRAERTAAARDAATVAVFKQVLKPEQHRRAAQFAVRELWNGPYQSGRLPIDNGFAHVSAGTLSRHPELAAALKLTAEQKKIVAAVPAPPASGSVPWGGSTSAVVYLTPGQVATATALLGAPGEQPIYPREDPRLSVNTDTATGLVELAQVKDVRAHLGLTPAQEKELLTLAPGSGGRRPTPQRWQSDPSLSPAAQKQIADIVTAEARAALATVLKPDQLARLEQIHRRAQQYATATTEAGLAAYSEVELDLGGYTPEQNKQLDAAIAAHNAAVEKAVRDNAPFAATEKAIAAAGAARDNAYLAVLTPAQAKKLKELYGEPFTGDTQSPDQPGGGGFLGGGQPGGGGGFPGDFGPRMSPDPVFGNYVHELTHVSRDPGLAAELKLSDEQVKKLRFAAFEYYERHGGTPSGWSSNVLTNPAAREFVAKSLKDILTPEQGKRFREIMLQLREKGGAGGPSGVRSAVSYPGVAEEVKLTPEQRTQLFTGLAPARVLTEEQKTAVRALQGEPYKGLAALTRGGFGAESERQSRERQFGRYTVELALAAWNPTLATDLKLTDEQLKKLRTAAFEYAERFGTGTGQSPPLAATDAAGAFLAQALADNLTADQAKRFREIMLQLRNSGAERGFGGASRTASAVSYPGVAEKVKLAPEQKEKLLDGVAPAEVLTADQKAALKAMLGEPHENLAAFTTAGRGGFGGNPWAGGPGGGRRAAPVPAVLTLPWGALKLTAEQGEKLAAAANRYALATLADAQPGGRRGGFGGEPTSPPRSTAATQAFEEEVAGVLTDEQKARLSALALQQFAAADGLQVALARDDIAKHVNPTAEQVRKIAAAEAELRTFAGLVEAAGIDTDRQERACAVLQDRLDARILAVLTDEQKAAWKELVGEPWPGFKKAGLTATPRGATTAPAP